MPTSADNLYGLVTTALLRNPTVTQKRSRGFGSNGLFTSGKLFAVLRGDMLLLKLPAERVAKLVSTSAGVQFDANKGRPMREWVLVRASSAQNWIALAREAMDFVERF